MVMDLEQVRVAYKLNPSQLNEVVRWSIFYRPEEFNGNIREYIGWIEKHIDRFSVCVLDVHFDENNLLDREVSGQVERECGNMPYALYRVDAEDIELVQMIQGKT